MSPGICWCWDKAWLECLCVFVYMWKRDKVFLYVYMWFLWFITVCPFSPATLPNRQDNAADKGHNSKVWRKIIRNAFYFVPIFEAMWSLCLSFVCSAIVTVTALNNLFILNKQSVNAILLPLLLLNQLSWMCIIMIGRSKTSLYLSIPRIYQCKCNFPAL